MRKTPDAAEEEEGEPDVWQEEADLDPLLFSSPSVWSRLPEFLCPVRLRGELVPRVPEGTRSAHGGTRLVSSTGANGPFFWFSGLLCGFHLLFALIWSCCRVQAFDYALLHLSDVCCSSLTVGHFPPSINQNSFLTTLTSGKKCFLVSSIVCWAHVMEGEGPDV